MKPFQPILAVVVALAGNSPGGESEAVVRFTNNDRLTGTVESLSADQLVWNSPILEKPARLSLKKVIDLSMPSNAHDVDSDHEATVSLVGGDTVRGQLASVSDETVALDTWYAGRMNFNRLMVSGVKIDGKSSFVYRGPTGLDGWEQSKERSVWTYDNLSLRSNGAGGIAREDLLPESCIIRFDIAWKGDALGLKAIVFSDSASSDGSPAGYEVAFQRGSVYLRNCKTSSFIGSTQSQVLMENDKAKIEIRAASKSGKVCLFINEQMIESWLDPDAARGKFGRCLHFVSQNASPMKISGISVAQWDGVVDRAPEPRVGMMRHFGMRGQDDESKLAPKVKPKEGRMELANGDTLEGEVVKIEDGLIALKTPLGDFKLPVSRLRSVALKKVDLEESKKREGDIRAWFTDGTSLVFRLDKVENGTISGFSQNFGTATFKIEAFNRIEFNIYPKFDEKRPPADW